MFLSITGSDDYYDIPAPNNAVHFIYDGVNFVFHLCRYDNDTHTSVI